MQPELFEDLQQQPAQRRFQVPVFPHRFLRLRVAYEDLIFWGLSLILVLLAGFCFGVERGKRLNPSGVVPAQTAPAMPITPVAAKPAVKESVRELPPTISVPVPQAAKASVPASQTRQEMMGQYAIQLASYLDNRVAQAEAQRLKRQGFNAVVIKQGKYIELRVIGYRTRSEALNSLVALKKLYHDGFIKRISPSYA